MMTSKDAQIQSIKSRKAADLSYNKLHETCMLKNPDYIEIYTLLEDEIKMACRLGLHDAVIPQARLSSPMLGLALEVMRHNGFVFFANEYNLRISWAA
jgi:hypothetical protein